MIKVKILDILEGIDRNIRWLASKADINYSTLYNFAHNNTKAVNYDVLIKLCETLDCNIQDIIEYTPNYKTVVIESKSKFIPFKTKTKIVRVAEDNKKSNPDQE